MLVANWVSWVLERVGAPCGALAWRSDVMLLIKALLDTPFWDAKLFSVVLV